MGRPHLHAAALLLGILLGAVLPAVGQSAPLMVVGSDTVHEGAFRYAFEKNRAYTLQGKQMGVEEFLNSYRDFRLKVLDARHRGLDTSAAFRMEYEKYRNYQLASRLLDSARREQMYRAAYDRMQREVDASHILLPVPEGGDTLAAYTLAQQVRQRVLAGEDFGSLARQYSSDPSAQQNGGHLGYFGAFTMVAPFEQAAYATQVDSVSQPVRSNFGYHIIRVNGNRPSRGKMLVAHIMKLVPAEADSAHLAKVNQKLDSIRRLAQGGTDFAALAQAESEDASSSQRGGMLPWVSTGRYPETFTQAAFELKEDGELSTIVRSPFGLHLLKRIAYQPVPSFEAARETIRNSFARDGIVLEGEHALRSAMQRLADLKLHSDALLRSRQHITEHPGSPLPDSIAKEPFAEVGGRTFYVRDIPYAQGPRPVADSGQAAAPFLQAAQQLVDDAVEECAERRLVAQYPELGYTLSEFRDGLLLFEVSEREVWRAPEPDSAKLRRLYRKNRKSLRFEHCYEVEVYSSADKEKLAAARTQLVQLAPSGQSAPLAAGDSITVTRQRFDAESPMMRGYKPSATQGANTPAEMGSAPAAWEHGVSPVMAAQGGKSQFLRVVGEAHNVRKTFAEASGDLQTLYQEEAEQRWLHRLSKRYPVKVNKMRIDELEALYAQ